jgi:signal transduction histidine kinase
MKIFQVVFIVIFLGALYLTWYSYDGLNDQRSSNRVWLERQARSLNNQLVIRLEDWKNELAKKTPANVGQCLAMKEAAISQGSPLWPISPFTGIDNYPYWLDDEGRLYKSKLDEFESALYHDRYLIRFWLEIKEERNYSMAVLESLLGWARRGEDEGKAFMNLSGRVYVHPLLIILPAEKQIRGWRANLIPDDLFAFNNVYIKLSQDKSADDLLNHLFLGASFNWTLTPDGKEFLYQARGMQGLILSATLTIVIFIYVIYFFYRNQRLLSLQATQREQMVSDISHELRTPVTTIKLYAEMLRDGRITEKEKQQVYYSRLVNESLRLGRLIENVLDFSRINQQRLRLNLNSINLETLQKRLEEVIDFLDKDNRVVFDWPKEETISADTEAVIQVFYNLISNALKYSENGPIDIDSRDVRGKLVITIRDQGDGIPSEEVKNLFKSFYRGKKAHQQQTQGSGLGLGIARGLMEAMNGSLDFAGNRPGACFEVTFTRCKTLQTEK